NIKDNATNIISSVTSKLRAFGSITVSAIANIKDNATNIISNVTSKLRTLGSIIVTPIIKAKDMATTIISSATSKLKSFGSMSASAIIKVKDSASSVISSISSKIQSLVKGVTIPIAISTAMLGGAVSMGMTLEQQQISIEHFIGATNTDYSEEQVKSVSAQYLDDLRTNANATPFETGDVISAGARAIAISKGNTSEAMDLVQLSEDMASASGGTKTIMDAVEALADASVGEMERLKEFGFKFSMDDFNEIGYEGVTAELSAFFGGASEKLATSGAGLLSTITGKIKSNISDFGLLVTEELKPVFEKVIEFIDATTPAMQEFGVNMANHIGNGITFIMDLMPAFHEAFNSLKPLFSSILQAVEPIFSGIASAIQTIAPMIQPVFEQIVTTLTDVVNNIAPIIASVVDTIGANFGNLVPIFESVVSNIQTVISNMTPVISSVISSIGSTMESLAPVISSVVSTVGAIIETLAPIFQTVFETIQEKLAIIIPIIGDLITGLGGIVEACLPIISTAFDIAWGVISPILDMAVSGIELLHSVVKTVFGGIESTISSAWSVIKPIAENIGNVLGNISSGISSSVSGALNTVTSKVSSLSIGKNAKGTNSWSGGLTWVGEEGPELLDLPSGSRILPNKESISFASPNNNSFEVPKVNNNSTSPNNNSGGEVQNISINIAKLSESIVVKEEADIDRIGNEIASKIKLSILNLA
ncbi:MAG: hypothetical protein R3Y29_04425, partial [bacterium]